MPSTGRSWELSLQEEAGGLHVVRELLEVGLLLGELLLELPELLLLALADRKVLAGALPPLEGITVSESRLVAGCV